MGHPESAYLAERERTYGFAAVRVTVRSPTVRVSPSHRPCPCSRPRGRQEDPHESGSDPAGIRSEARFQHQHAPPLGAAQARSGGTDARLPPRHRARSRSRPEGAAGRLSGRTYRACRRSVLAMSTPARSEAARRLHVRGRHSSCGWPLGPSRRARRSKGRRGRCQRCGLRRAVRPGLFATPLRDLEEDPSTQPLIGHHGNPESPDCPPRSRPARPHAP